MGDEYAEDDAALDAKIVELMKEKVKLDNGEEGYVFTKSTDENPRGRFRCHVCNVPICSTKSLEEHASGKNHIRKMKTPFHSHETFSKIVLQETSKLTTDLGGKVITAPGVEIPDLAPGEPVPPGFEDIVTRVPEITSTLAEMKAPLIGLEFLAEITPIGEEVEPKYCCLLCNKRGDPRTVLAHLVCFNHRIKYIGRYFPRTNTALALIPKVKEYKRGTGEVLAKIVKAIENKFGRLNPVIVDGAVFDEKKEEYYREMSAGRHFHETADSNYESLVDLEFIKKCAPEADNILTIDLEKEEAKKKSSIMKNESNFNKNKFKSLHDQSPKKISEKTYQVPSKRAKREKSVETISTISSRSRSPSRSRSRSYSRSPSWDRSRSRSHSKSRSRYRYMYRDYKRSERETRRRSPPRNRHYNDRRDRHSRSRSRSRERLPSYRRNYRPLPYARPRSPIRPAFRTIRYDSLYNDEDDYPASERPKSTQRKVAELRDKRKKWDLYKEFVEKLEKDMSKTLKGYEKNPEKHPLYPEEWKKFWNRRYKELTAEGVDASKHDFKPEWIKFWTVRMKELHNEELKSKKDKYRTELGLPDSDAPGGVIDEDVIEVSPTPLEDDKTNVTVDDIKNTWKALTGSDIKGVNSKKAKSPEKSDNYELGSVKIDPNQPVRVITVLRLLTALESQLGSLGPRVNNLLSQAIALENKKENSSDSLIDVSENSVLFETVKEKLKGQLFAGIVEKHMVNATRVAIQNVAELFNKWKAKKENPEPVVTVVPVPVPVPAVVAAPAPIVQEPLIVPGIGAVDKVAIAQQIASALIAQGKTNVSEQELEQLINAVVGMAQANTYQQQQPAVAPPVVAPVVPQPVPAPVSIPALSPAVVVEPEVKPDPVPAPPVSVANNSLKLLQNYDESSQGKGSKRMTAKDMADLTEEDMKLLLQNFKELSPEEQQCLITYLKELEAKDPDEVEKLRKFVNLGGENKNEKKDESSGRLSPFSMREGGANPFIDDGSRNRHRALEEEDEEEDYSYEDIYKAAEKKVSGRTVVQEMLEEQQKKSKGRNSPSKDYKKSEDPECVLDEAKVMIANIMGQLPTKFTGGITRTTTTNVRTAPLTTPKQVNLVDPTPKSAPAAQRMYDNQPQTDKPMDNNLLNDYNYQDDLFGYSTENYQNYSSVNQNYQREPNVNDVIYSQIPQQQLQPPMYEYDKPPDQVYNVNYNEPWNNGNNYQQFQPPPQNQYIPQDIPQGPPMMQQMQQMQQMFDRPMNNFQMPPQNDYNRPAPNYDNHNNYHREYY